MSSCAPDAAGNRTEVAPTAAVGATTPTAPTHTGPTLGITGLGSRPCRPPWAGRPSAGSSDPASCVTGPSGPLAAPSGATVVPVSAAPVPPPSPPVPSGPVVEPSGSPVPAPTASSDPCGLPSGPLSVEICCGSANLSLHLRKQGFEIFPVDHKENRFTPRVPFHSLDLTVPSGQARLWEILSSQSLSFVHMSPPCGTASRAREKRISEADRARGIPEPQPLRSEQFPLGLPTLAADFPHEVARVRKANIIYRLCADVAAFCSHRLVPWTLENPSNSLFWYIPFVSDLLSLSSVEDVVFQSCMHGGRRDKRTRLRCGPSPAFSILSVMCDGSHDHLPWGASGRGHFHTADEAEFPDLLCARLSLCAWSARPPLPTFLISDTPSPPMPNSSSTKASETAFPDCSRFSDDFASQEAPKSRPKIPALNADASMSFLPPSTSTRPASGASFTAQEVDSYHYYDYYYYPRMSHHVVSPSVRNVFPCSSSSASDAVHARTRTGAVDDPEPTPIAVEASRPTAARDTRIATRVAAAVQPRGASSPTAIPEYHSRTWLRIPDSFTGEPQKLVGSQVSEAFGSFPKGSKFLSLRIDSGEAGSEEFFLEVGVAWSTSQFVSRALSLKHPFDTIAVDDDILRSVFASLTAPPAATRQHREATLAFWRERALQLEEREEDLRRQVHPDVRKSIEGKKLLLFGEMLHAAGFPRPSALIFRMAAGFPLLGNIEATGVFPEKKTDATATLRDLWSQAKALQATALSAVGPSSDPKLDEEVTKVTKEEVEKGWLVGPYTPEQLSSKHGLWVPVRRFGIWQGSGSRVIDDYSEYGQNACTSTVEKIDVGGIDTVASLARGVLAALDASSRTVRVKLSDGTVLEGRLHREWSVDSAKSLVGKVWDLAKAYRQLARAPGHASVSIVVTYNSVDKKTELYEQPVLPFGAKASVWDFNWTARGLWKALAGLFGFMSTHYFDDFPVLEFSCLSDHTQTVFDQVLDLLGWDTKKQIDFAPSFDVLGVVCDLSSSTTDCVRFRNKPKRLEELQSDIDRVVSTGYIRRGEARSLRGRFQFARGQTFGRCGAVAMKMLGLIADGTKGSPALDDRTAASLRHLMSMLHVLRPRELHAKPPPPLVLFVDGACDMVDGKLRVSIGAVLYDPSSQAGPKFFGTLVGDPVVRLWSRDAKEQLIGQAELLPVLLAKTTWRDSFVNRPCLTFIDNESARYSLMRGYSPVLDSSRIISESWTLDAELGSASWFARVPTCCNVADDPSRLDFTVLESTPHSVKCDVSIPSSWGKGDLWSVLASWLARDL